MKQKRILLLILSMNLFMCSCGNKKDSKDKAKSEGFTATIVVEREEQTEEVVSDAYKESEELMEANHVVDVEHKSVLTYENETAEVSFLLSHDLDKGTLSIYIMANTTSPIMESCITGSAMRILKKDGGSDTFDRFAYDIMLLSKEDDSIVTSSTYIKSKGSDPYILLSFGDESDVYSETVFEALYSGTCDSEKDEYENIYRQMSDGMTELAQKFAAVGK